MLQIMVQKNRQDFETRFISAADRKKELLGDAAHGEYLSAPRKETKKNANLEF